LRLAGKTILITGASSGIGKAIALECNHQEATVIILGRKAEKLAETQKQMQYQEMCSSYTCDFTEINSIGKTCSEICSATSIDGIVHAAGVSFTIPFKQLSIETLIETFQTNLLSLGEMLAALQDRVSNGASIVIISSIMSVMGQKGKLSYSASKGALDAMMRSLALEYAKKQIRVNSILPGVVQTPLQEALFAKLPEEAVDEIEHSHPLGLGSINDVVSTTIFLLSDRSKYITGSQVSMDGGYSAA
jgi:NAD(P)-dependent dehydrogenase (short-subunit alcohol dehydrogenase family)